MQQREYELRVKNIEEIKQLVEFRGNALIQHLREMQFSCFSVLPGSAEAQVN